MCKLLRIYLLRERNSGFKGMLVILLIALFPIVTNAETVQIEGIWYNLTIESGNEAKVIQNKNFKYEGKVIIPEVIIYKDVVYNVTSIGYGAFSGCTGLTSITIPNSVTSIGDHAFYDCSDLTSITIPNSVTSIGEYAFRFCKFTSITIPNSVKSIGNGAFLYCRSLTSINIPDSVKSVGEYTFSGCTSLSNITIPNSVTSIERVAFSGCTSLASVTIGNSVTYIGETAFSSCTNLTTINLGNSVNSIENNAFSGCTDLTNIAIPNSVTSIGDYAFSSCTNLKTIILGNSVKSIGNNAFSGCFNLETVINLSTLSITKGASSYGCIARYATNIINADGQVGDFIFFKTTNGIYSLIRYNGKNNEKVLHLPNNYKGENYEIGDDAFLDCKELTNITIPNSVTSIGKNAFKNCTELTNIIVPNSVKNIGEDAFEGCTNLTNVTIGNSVTNIGSSAFYGCVNLSAVHITNLESWCNIDFLNGSSNPLYYAKHLFINGEEVKDLLIPNSVTSIRDYAFCYCTNLTSIAIPYSATSIGEYAFYDCSDLTSITIPNSVMSIGEYAFCGCTGLKNVTIGNSVTNIGSSAFHGCNKLETVINFSTLNINKGALSNGYVAYHANRVINADEQVGDFFFKTTDRINYLVAYIGNDNDLTLPEDYKGKDYEIGNDAFQNCTNLTSITIPNSVTSIGKYAFLGCNKLKTVVNYSTININKGGSSNGYVAYHANRVINADEQVGNFFFKTMNGVHYLVGYIGNENDLTLPKYYNGENYAIGDYAFYEYTGITSITIPNSVECIGENTFNNCVSLTNVTIGNSVKSIGDYAFSGCTGLPCITIPNSVTNIGESTFYGCSSLTTISISKNVTNIGSRAFYGCKGLTSITMPNSVTSIGTNAFYGCVNLSDVHITNLECWCNIKFSDSNSNPLYYAKHLFLNGKEVKDLLIPNSVTSIGDYAFWDYAGVTSVTIPNSVTSIGDYAFSGCTGLTNIAIPNSVTSIGDYAFYNCSSLTSITIPNSVTSIGEYAFYECGLTSIILGDSVTSIGGYAFSRCTGLSSITIPNSVENIGRGAFSGCTGLTNIAIPNSVTSIGDYAFFNCSSLTSITIPSSVKSIGEYALHGIKTIINFSNCNISSDSAENIINVDNLQYEQYGDFIFRNKDNYEFYLSAYIGTEKNISLPKKFYGKKYNIDDKAFCYRSDLTSITIPNFVTTIGNYAFVGCTGITEITIPSSVTSIEKDAFRGCTNLTDITIGNAIEVIGDYAFGECENLKSITMASTTPPSVGGHDFTTTDFRTIIVRVPQGSLAAYQTADFWKSFWNIEEFNVTGIEDVQMDTHNTTAPIYTLQGVQVKEAKESLPSGIYIQDGKKFIVK